MNPILQEAPSEYHYTVISPFGWCCVPRDRPWMFDAAPPPGISVGDWEKLQKSMFLGQYMRNQAWFLAALLLSSAGFFSIYYLGLWWGLDQHSCAFVLLGIFPMSLLLDISLRGWVQKGAMERAVIDSRPWIEQKTNYTVHFSSVNMCFTNGIITFTRRSYSEPKSIV